MQPYLWTQPSRQDQYWHEGDLPQYSQHQRVSQHKQLVAETPLLVQPCSQCTGIAQGKVHHWEMMQGLKGFMLSNIGIDPYTEASKVASLLQDCCKD